MQRGLVRIFANGTVVLLMLWGAPTGLAQHETPHEETSVGEGSHDETPPGAATKSDEGDSDGLSITHHSVTIDGRTIAYTATTGTMTLPDYEGEPRADIFFIAYTLDLNEGDDVASRPITFAFNGGPGSSSVWLHLGALGPRRVDLGPQGFDFAPPFRLVDNDQSWLDLTDLVFIDPVSTGYSRPADGHKKSEFHGLNEDIAAVGEFIRLWTTRNSRWSSPKFLAGESYGTTRAAGLSGYLQSTLGMELNGIVLISPVLNFQTIRFGVGNDMPFWLYLPTYTATAYYHGKLDADLMADLPATLTRARQWAQGDYLAALARGDALSAAQRRIIAHDLARYTGLSAEFVERSDLRVSIFNFTKELLRDDRLTVGRLDSRYTGRDRLGIGTSPEYDPSYAAIQGPYTSALNDYVRRELGYENDLVYEILTGRVRPWSYASHENRYVNVAETLRRAMTRNPSLKVLIACGYFDLATPFFAAEYTASHLGLDASLRDNISFAYFAAGHMMYVRRPDLAGLKTAVAELYADALDGD